MKAEEEEKIFENKANRTRMVSMATKKYSQGYSSFSLTAIKDSKTDAMV